MDFSCKVRVMREHSSMCLHASTSEEKSPTAPKIHFKLSYVIKNEPHIPKATQTPMRDWLAVFVTRSGPFQGHKGQV